LESVPSGGSGNGRSRNVLSETKHEKKMALGRFWSVASIIFSVLSFPSLPELSDLKSMKPVQTNVSCGFVIVLLGTMDRKMETRDRFPFL